MPIYDRRCDTCGREDLDRYETIEFTPPQCGDACPGVLERFLSAGQRGAIDDSIPGGLEIRNGLCNPDGTPRKYYHRSEIRREEKKRGLLNLVEHKPPPGTDKSKHTSRWV